MKLKVEIVEHDDGSFRGRCRALPGCEVRGESRQQVQQDILRAVQAYLASLDVALPQNVDQFAQVA